MVRIDRFVNVIEVDNVQFPIAEYMHVNVDKGMREITAFNFSDTANKRYMFEFDEENQMTQIFLLTLAQCLYEATYNRPHKEASEEDLQELLHGSSTSKKAEFKYSPVISS